MTLEKQISNTCRTSYMQIRRISGIRHYLPVDAVRTLVQATVIARLDYCNSIYTNLSIKSIHRLQITQYSAARLISRTPRHEHITPVLVQLHWVPITMRCQFNILTMPYKASHHNAPTYICDMLNWYQPARTLLHRWFQIGIEPLDMEDVYWIHHQLHCGTPYQIILNLLTL